MSMKKTQEESLRRLGTSSFWKERYLMFEILNLQVIKKGAAYKIQFIGLEKSFGCVQKCRRNDIRS